MAFVSGAGAAVRGTSGKAAARCAAVRTVRAARAIRMTTAPGSAPFSSLDEPERQVVMWESVGDEKDQVFKQLYRQVFGNAYLMESDLEELLVPESQLLMGSISVKDFIKRVAKSDAYKKRFFEPCGPYRFVELCTKHFLGRGPRDQKEVSEHVQRLANEGYDADVDSYMDSEEYMSLFGENGVPRFVFKGTYEGNDQFNRLAAMRQFADGSYTDTRSGSTAPRKAQKAELTMAEGDFVGRAKVSRGLPAETSAAKTGTPPVRALKGPVNPRAGVRVRIKVVDNLYQVYEIPPMADPKAKVNAFWAKPIPSSLTKKY
ncbi:Phycobilisome 27.9 kDa linker polypeptide, phycoerythrin-associated, rod [Porphyridium purpureum]|uniref:Phycobilisome 27.9 kDa linker polypeptide, phycoerythrin-associated, rod n=1 Tax=Porphyridium purpureum TaxID=35688 RepID=A0A5J4Z323_PORPP|nr:Chain MC, Phycobilisome 27.9 kDa linker polypeptide, phycoerythrin-associated, rod [Porphyridium purpureum]7EZX_ME Chain ME, Phycobilisome 27.9 kDa linker polypeptide, phycoerythrin-associated, rod [Porphyridium purpureum]7LJ0_A Chain A, Linker 3 [Porphyridium purpureum]7Y4L_MG Chain MG, Phycobilisome 27.9 kDa linker polypeptide, phycoerythrin-associated, rod [Porphyridium purpureum]7Y4L_ZG Chain ZG, Phycobilisome 27.9 kDa linker polypeptide, phycoerythrin-associated, rod [Porphyridium purpu|eukprot:POR1179..scf208_2